MRRNWPLVFGSNRELSLVCMEMKRRAKETERQRRQAREEEEEEEEEEREREKKAKEETMDVNDVNECQFGHWVFIK